MSLIAIYRSRQEESFPLKQEIERQKVAILALFWERQKTCNHLGLHLGFLWGKKEEDLKYTKSLVVFFFSLKAHHESFIISLAAPMEMIQKVENTTLQSIVKNATP